MTNWQRFAEAMDGSLGHEIKAARADTKEAAVEAAEAALEESKRALGLAASPPGQRFAHDRCERLEADVAGYRERGGETWPAARDAEAGARFKVALEAGLDHSLEAMQPESREEVAGLYGKAAARLAEAAVAAPGENAEEAARRSHKYAAGQVERVADPREWPMLGEIKALLQKLDREGRQERGSLAERRGIPGFAR